MVEKIDSCIKNITKVFIKLQERSFNLFKENAVSMSASAAYERRGLYDASEIIIACFPTIKKELKEIMEKYDDKEIKFEKGLKSKQVKNYFVS